MGFGFRARLIRATPKRGLEFREVTIAALSQMPLRVVGSSYEGPDAWALGIAVLYLEVHGYLEELNPKP